MTNIGTTTISEGQKAFCRLRERIDNCELRWNEAETRFHIIDRIIVECLGWPREAVRLEQSQAGRAYSDYELGQPRSVIWEAKRENRTFELPAKIGSKIVGDLPSILALGGEAADAVRQVQEYCSQRGVEIAVATNGRQLVAFLATRSDGTAPLDGRCLVIDGYDHFAKDFPTVWQCLSPAGVVEHRLNRLLRIGEDTALPPKLSSLLSGYPRYRYPSDLQTTLRTIGELLLVDVMEQEDSEREFYKRCYCESGALSQHALVSKRLLAARYAALFDPAKPGPKIEPVKAGPREVLFTPEVMAEALAQRPIVLLGDVGVGKTSFLKHLMYVSAFGEFRNALYLYIDLGSKGALAKDFEEFVLSEMETQLRLKYGIDVHKNEFVRGVYGVDIERFGEGIYGKLAESAPAQYEAKLVEMLEGKIRQRDQHLKAAIAHVVRKQKKQVIFVLDNADQRDYEIQQGAFIIAQNFAKDWAAAVFIAVRPQTFYKSKQAGSLTAYPHRVFTIAPPRVDEVIERRLGFAVNMAEGRIRVDRLRDIALQLTTVASFLKALLFSLSKSKELLEFLSNITAGNIRAVVEFVTKFIGSACVGPS